MLLVMVTACGNKRAQEEQERLDRRIEESGGLYRDTDGRSYKIVGDKAKYIDARGGDVPADKIPAGAPRPPPAETDVTRGEEAAARGDEAGAAALYKSACDAKVPGGCGHLALLHRFGEGVASDPGLAESMARKECDGGDAFGCYALGIVFETVPGTDGKARPAADVIALYDKGCTGGSVDACNALGMVYHSGRGGAPKDPAKAAAALTRGCELGDRMSCHQVNMVKR
jgi:TPR repeat protein